MSLKISFFSDTHGLHRKINIPKSDILIFGGDCMTDGYIYYELVDFLNWFDDQPATHKILVAGNHDRLFELHPELTKSLLLEHPNITYLENSGTVIDGVNIWGSPDSHFFCNWAFNRSSEELTRSFSQIPDDTDILVTHAPQYGIADELEAPYGHVGEPELSEQMNRFHNLKYHLVGHIHNEYGIYGGRGDFKTINGSIVNEQYKVRNKPITFYL